MIAIMLRRARIADGMRVLEPEAGSGYIADAIRAAHPGAWVDTVEISPRLRDMLVLKNYRVMAFDFLEFENDQEAPYDRIVMNPPFERQQDLDHIRHAYKLLAPGGILVSVLSPSFEFRSDRKSTEFRAWIGSQCQVGEPARWRFQGQRYRRQHAAFGGRAQLDSLFDRCPKFQPGPDPPTWRN